MGPRRSAVRPIFVFAWLAGCGRDCPLWYPDEDGDGFGAQGEGLAACDPKDVPGRVDNALDCRDLDAAIHPDADEVCDEAAADEDCDGLVNDEDDVRSGEVASWADQDGDGYGDPLTELRSCAIPAGRVDNMGDCDDAQAQTFPGAAERDDELACMPDVDLDGYGAAPSGTDCDDAAATTFPGAPEAFGDGADQDCDTLELWELFDDFEAEQPSAEVWSGATGEVVIEERDGNRILELSWESSIETVPLDTSLCENLAWSYLGTTSGSEQGPLVQFFDGEDWIEVDPWLSRRNSDFELELREGLFPSPAAYHVAFAMRLLTRDPFSLDDFRLVCTGPDADGDGYGERDDCDESDAVHWHDCGQCVDGDADGFGRRCDLGPDCDDADPAVSPAGPDLATDGLDEDCNGYDGPSLFDDFESAEQNERVWASMSGAFLSERDTHSGQWSLGLPPDSQLVSVPFDTTVCESLWWSYWVKRDGPPEATDALVLSWDDGTDWVPLDTLQGNGSIDGTFLRRHGVLSDPAALWSGFRLRLQTGESNDPSDLDEYIVDDVLITCSAPDGDGDGFPSDRDCDDTDAAHWQDCGACLDADADGYGLDCDLGPDCDDAELTVHPGGADLYGDSSDTDCDGYDGQTLWDDFEEGYPSPEVWEVLSETEVSDHHASSGEFALELNRDDLASTRPLDTSDCPAIRWTLQGTRATPPPQEEQFLLLSYSDGASWRPLWRWYGTGEADDEPLVYWGLIQEPDALSAGFRLGFEASALATATYVIDDFVVACSEPDLDLDGYTADLDCDDADPAHWSDCATCEDSDGDSFGPGCTQGGDCAPDDGAVHPGALDVWGDGQDPDCSGLDGPDLVEDFEEGTLDPMVWSESSGSVELYNDGNVSLRLSGEAQVTSTLKDLSPCDSLSWSYEFRSRVLFDASARLLLEWWDGTSWLLADEVDDWYEPDFQPRVGELDAPAALVPGFRLRLRTEGSRLLEGYDVDNLVLTCVTL
jgi:hypothetical protein